MTKLSSSALWGTVRSLRAFPPGIGSVPRVGWGLDRMVTERTYRLPVKIMSDVAGPSGDSLASESDTYVMSDRTGALADDAHAAAAEAFVDRVMARFDEDIEELFVFGSTVRGDARGLASDVDVMVVLDDDVDQETVADALRDVAYDVMLEHGPVVELHVLSAAEFRDSRSRGDFFVETIVSEGRSYA